LADKFSAADVEALLVACHRRCCVCHRFCGVKMEIDHIIPLGEGGPSTRENGIPVCFECHAEIHSYNVDHPRGRKFRAEELRKHRDQWFELCKVRPEVFNVNVLSAEAGPLQALIDELEFNRAVANQKDPHGCMFSDEQFRKAISQGSIAILKEDLKEAIVKAYVAMGAANQRMTSAAMHSPAVGDIHHKGASKAAQECGIVIDAAHASLLMFLRSE